MIRCSITRMQSLQERPGKKVTTASHNQKEKRIFCKAQAKFETLKLILKKAYNNTKYYLAV